MTPLDQLKQSLTSFIQARERATPKYYVEHPKMRHFKNDVIGVDCCEEEPFVLAQMNRNMENWGNDLTFIALAANSSARYAKLLGECLAFIEGIASKREFIRDEDGHKWPRPTVAAQNAQAFLASLCDETQGGE